MTVTQAVNIVSSHRKRVRKQDGVDRQPLENIVESLVKQIKATKTIHFRYRGVVTASREVPDHRVQLRALDEMCKLLDLYPRPGDLRRIDRDGQTRPLEIYVRT